MPYPADLVQTDCMSPLGRLHLAASGRGLAGLWFEDQAHRPAALSGPSAWPQEPQLPLFQAAREQLKAYFDRRLQTFDLPLDLSSGTTFQQAVWHRLLDIGPGQHISYGELARQLGRPQAARAVGAAVGRNPLSIVLPCHRVLGQGGQLTGYAAGLPRKTALLALEQPQR